MEMNKKLLETIEFSKNKKEQLEKELENISDDFDRIGKINKEIKRLSPMVKEYNLLMKAIEDKKQCLAYIEQEKDKEMLQALRDELADLENRIEVHYKECEILSLPKDPNDDKNIIVEMRPAAGGDEASIFVGDLFNTYKIFCNKMSWKIEVTEAKISSHGGFDMLVFTISGDNVYSMMKHESGVHRVQRVPATESKGRTHTSTITVVVMPELDELDVKLDMKDIRVDVMRASGAGGQSVNRTESAVRLTHLPTNIVVYCQEGKSQNENKAQALKVLRAKLWDKAESERQSEMSSLRKGQIGSGDRSEKIRTYNYPQNRVTDHRIGLTLNKLDQVMEGQLEELVNALKSEEQRVIMENMQNETLPN